MLQDIFASHFLADIHASDSSGLLFSFHFSLSHLHLQIMNCCKCYISLSSNWYQTIQNRSSIFIFKQIYFFRKQVLSIYSVAGNTVSAWGTMMKSTGELPFLFSPSGSSLRKDALPQPFLQVPSSLCSSLVVLSLERAHKPREDLLSARGWAPHPESLMLAWDPGMLISDKFPRDAGVAGLGTTPETPHEPQDRYSAPQLPVLLLFPGVCLCCPLCLVQAWLPHFITSSERTSLSLLVNIALLFPGTQCHILWFCSFLDFCHSPKLSVYGCLEGDCDWWRDINRSRQRTHVSLV